MSASLLHKSLKLFEEESGKSTNKGVHKNLQKHNKRKRQIIASNSKKEEIIKANIEANLKAIQILNHYCVSNEVSKKVIKHSTKADISLESKPCEEKSVFTEEDFERFEAEYEDH